MFEAVIVETRKQHARIWVIQSFDVGIIITKVETVATPNIDVVGRGLWIGSATKLGSRSCGVLAVRNLSWSLTLLATITGVVDIPQMVFFNPITTTHMNRTTDRPLMNSMPAGGYKSVDVMHPRKGYWKPFTVTSPILDHRYGHYVRPNRVAFKYLDFKKDVDPNVHFRMFNYGVKINVETFEEYIINASNYMLKDTTVN